MQKERKFFSWFIVVASRENRDKIKTFQFLFQWPYETFSRDQRYFLASSRLCNILHMPLFLWLRLCLFIAYLVAGLKSSLTVWWNQQVMAGWWIASFRPYKLSLTLLYTLECAF